MKRLTKTDQNVWNFYIRNLPSKKTINLETQKLNFKKDYKFKKLKSGDNFYIDKKDFKNLKNNSLKVDAILDLHGFNKIEAYSKLTNFVKNCYTNNLKNVVVITGKGDNNKGILKLSTPKWLVDEKISKYIVGFNEMPDKRGGQGALFIKLKNKYKYK